MGGVTIKDVAKRSGVSITTVSRAINGTGYVRESTRAKVLEAVRSLGFSPNLLARSLSSGSSKIVGAIFPDISNPFFPAVARGIDDVLASRGYMLVICNSDNDVRQEEAVVGALMTKGVDGIVFVTGGAESASLVNLASERMPVSLVDFEVPEGEYDTVSADTYGGAYEMTRHLASRGHRRIAFISGPLSLSASQKMLHGVIQCLKDMGVADEPLVCQGDFRFETGYSLAAEILSSGRGITAVFAANDLMALGAMKGFTDVGVLVPAQVAVAGFDDIFMASLARPSLSSVARPGYRIGAVAAEMLLERLDPAHGRTWARADMLEAPVIVRDSTGGGRVQP